MSDRHPARFFRFRKRDRDEAQDEKRLGRLRGAVRSVLAGAEAERAGLARRVEDLRGWVGDLMGDGCDGRDAAEERELVAAERLLLAGSARLARIDETVALFRAVDRLLDAARGAGAAADAGEVPCRALGITA